MKLMSLFSHISLDLRRHAAKYTVLFVTSSALTLTLILCADLQGLIQRHLLHEAGEINWVVFLKSTADKNAVEDAIRLRPGIQNIRFISKDEALRRIHENPTLSQTLTLTGRNPFPDAFEVHWTLPVMSGAFLEFTTRSLSQQSGVERIGYDKNRVARLDTLKNLLDQIQLTVFLLVSAGLLIGCILLTQSLFFTKNPLVSASWPQSIVIGMAGAVSSYIIGLKLIQTPEPWTIVVGVLAAVCFELGLRAEGDR
ncbi:MAG TPA: permease-like cell division protein FtsX [Elusimicrobiota bacterium]|nr:permease-like cell division protein FtsX [Elusimicrobiota bacterium]